MNAALKDCLEKQLTTVTKAVRPEAEAELNAALAACNAKHLKQPISAIASRRGSTNNSATAIA